MVDVAGVTVNVGGGMMVTVASCEVIELFEIEQLVVST
jgi:hypothetical protein